MAKNAVRRKPTNNKTRSLATRVDKQRQRIHFSTDSILRLLIFAAFSGLLAALASPTLSLLNPDYWPRPTDVYAPLDYISDIEFTTEVLALTEQARQEAADQVLPVYAFDSETLRNALENVGERIEKLHEARQMTTPTFEQKLARLRIGSVVPNEISEETAGFWLRSAIDEEPAPTESATEVEFDEAGEIAEDDASVPVTGAVRYRFDELRQSVTTILKEVLEEGVIADDEVKKIAEASDEKAQIELIKLRGDEPQKVVDVDKLRKVVDAKEEILKRAKDKYSDVNAASAVAEVASQSVQINIVPDEKETEKHRKEAGTKVEPVTKVVDVGQLIVRRASKLTPQIRQEIADFKRARDNARAPQRRVRGSVGHVIMLLLLMFGSARYLASIAPTVYSSLQQVTLTLLAITVMTGVAKLLSELGLSGYLVPAASVPILLAILMDRRVGLLAGAVLAILVSIVYGNDWNVLALVMAGSLAGVLGAVSVRKRSDLVRPGLIVAVVSIAVMVALGLMRDRIGSTEGLMDVRDAAINGLLVTLIVPATLSLFESTFKITTDIRLLELTDLNHPILRRLTMEAPGTHHHSLMVGNLAEAAAEAIGANSLLARVCSYYHDVGKLNRPEYFGENQTGYNKHDGLSPVMSSRIIAGHVKDGVELAREYGLCQPVVDIIQQHHGTDLIRFFYEKANRGDKHNQVRQEDFRYPGPKPQSREAAVVMVADAIESASRSLNNLTQARLRTVADKIVNTRFADGQFDNCDLTLRDLHVIAERIVTMLLSAHHKRIEYPDQESPEPVETPGRPSTN